MAKERRDLPEAFLANPSEYIIGIDEVGMGSWAGPVVVGAVVLPRSWSHKSVMDSKALTPKRRSAILDTVIRPSVLYSCVLYKSNEYIDRVGLGQAWRELVESAGVLCRIRYPQALIVLDGDNPVDIEGDKKNVMCFPKADSLVRAVAAASILAKVTRDAFMKQVSQIYPHYGFETNAGYHSEKHAHALLNFGPTPLHRMSFNPLKRMMRQREGRIPIEELVDSRRGFPGGT